MNFKNIQILLIILFLCTLKLFSQTGEWVTVTPMNIPRYTHTATVLEDGKVLVTGGAFINELASCEIYDPVNNSWQYTDSMEFKRNGHNVVMLSDGRVLVIGGGPYTSSNSCEIFDPVTETWGLTDSLITDRKYGAKIVKLKTGNILIAGGVSVDHKGNSTLLTNCEIFDVDSSVWVSAANLNLNRAHYELILLKDGRVLVSGGTGKNPNYKETASCEIYYPDLDEWRLVDSMNIARYNHSSVLLDDGKVFVSGGDNYHTSTSQWLKSCEIYDPVLDEWTEIGDLTISHVTHTTIQISDSILFIAGGDSDTWELFNLKKRQSEYIGLLSQWRFAPNIVQLQTGEILASGGSIWDNAAVYFTDQCELYNPNLTDFKNDRYDIDNFSLGQNYPNPFNPSTAIRYQIPSVDALSPVEVLVTLKVYDILGREITTIVNEEQKPGSYEVEFDGGNLSSGVYFYKLQAGKYQTVRKMLLIR